MPERLTRMIRGKLVYIFTPRLEETEERVRLWIMESWTPRGRRTSFTVTDARTGKKYKARTASCGLGRCLCDAVIFGYRKGKNVNS